MTDLQIVNRALSLIGSIQATSMLDTARNAVRAVTAYPRCRDEVLRMIPWPSGVTREPALNTNHMACPWITLSHYALGERVTNDTNKTYVCVTEGRTGAAPGPTGTGSGITDGTCVWNYVEVSSALTNWCHWPLKAYEINDIVAWATALTFGRRLYGCIVAGTTAAATPPTSIAESIADGTVFWCYYGTVPHNYTPYAYQYIVPYNALRVLKIDKLGCATDYEQGIQYTKEKNLFYCDQDDSIVRFIRNDVEPSNWDSLLQETIVLRIADEICFEITGQKDLAQLINAKWRMQYEQARQAALHEGAESVPEDPLWVDA